MPGRAWENNWDGRIRNLKRCTFTGIMKINSTPCKWFYLCIVKQEIPKLYFNHVWKNTISQTWPQAKQIFFGETTRRHTQSLKVTHIHTISINNISYAGKIEHYCSKLFGIGQTWGLRPHHFIDIYAINIIVHNIHATYHNHTQRHVYNLLFSFLFFFFFWRGPHAGGMGASEKQKKKRAF